MFPTSCFVVVLTDLYLLEIQNTCFYEKLNSYYLKGLLDFVQSSLLYQILFRNISASLDKCS